MKAQLTLLNLFLLTTAIALGVIYSRQLYRNEWYQSRIPGLKDAARELNVTDADLLHVVASHPEWSGERTWRVHVPTTGSYRLNLVTEGIPESLAPGPYREDYPAAEKTVDLSAGNHKIELRPIGKGAFEIEILVDEQSAIFVKKDKTWRGKGGISWTQDVENSKSFPKGQEVRLIHAKVDSGATRKRGESRFKGVLLWIVGSD